jgi:hypothetical protein
MPKAKQTRFSWVLTATVDEIAYAWTEGWKALYEEVKGAVPHNHRERLYLEALWSYACFEFGDEEWLKARNKIGPIRNPYMYTGGTPGEGYNLTVKP